MNVVFLALILLAFAVAAIRQVLGGADPLMPALSKAIVDDAASAVTLAIGLAGIMALFLGLMKVAEAAGALRAVARLLAPGMRRLFPSVPPEHPAMGAMVMNVAANVLGLGNAATPFGIRAMQFLDTLNPFKGTASDAMVLFLAINTASVTLLPTSVIALRAATGSANPAGIVPTTLLATVCSTAVAIVLARIGNRLWPAVAGDPVDPPSGISPDAKPSSARADDAAFIPAASPCPADQASPVRPHRRWHAAVVPLAVAALLVATSVFGSILGPWIIPTLITGVLLFGAARGVPVYERFVDGARDGFQIAVRIIPYLVAILVAVGMLRASGTLDLLITPVGTITARFGLPSEAVIMTALRMLTGSGAYAYLASVLNDPAIGPDSYTGYLVSTIQASTETTFYVVAVYFGAVGVRRVRHALFAGIGADLAGTAAAVVACSLLYG